MSIGECWAGRDAVVGIRAESIRVGAANGIPAVVEVAEPTGAAVLARPPGGIVIPWHIAADSPRS